MAPIGSGPRRSPGGRGRRTPRGAAARNEALRTSRRLGRANWRRWSGHRRRSDVETKMHWGMLLGLRLMARDFVRQVAELHVRIAAPNRFTALGVSVAEAIGQLRPEKGEIRPSPDFRNRVARNAKDRDPCQGWLSANRQASRAAFSHAPEPWNASGAKPPRPVVCPSGSHPARCSPANADTRPRCPGNGCQVSRQGPLATSRLRAPACSGRDKPAANARWQAIQHPVRSRT